MFSLKNFVLINWWTQKSLNLQGVRIKAFFLYLRAEEITLRYTAPLPKRKQSTLFFFFYFGEGGCDTG